MGHMKLSLPRTLAFMLGITFALAPLSAQAAPQTKSWGSTITALSSEKNKTKQAQSFADLMQAKLKYATFRSLAGREGSWLAFTDIYAYYENEELKSYVLQQANAQYGTQALPDNAESCTLSIGDSVYKTQYSKQSVFSFSAEPIPTANRSSAVEMGIVAGGKTTSIKLTQDYPNKNMMSARQIFQAVAPSYLSYYAKRAGAKDFDGDSLEVNHVVMRLKSYLDDMSSLERHFTWEIFLVQKSELPSKAVLIRYDCDTKKISISERELRDYFK